MLELRPAQIRNHLQNIKRSTIEVWKLKYICRRNPQDRPDPLQLCLFCAALHDLVTFKVYDYLKEISIVLRIQGRQGTFAVVFGLAITSTPPVVPSTSKS